MFNPLKIFKKKEELHLEENPLSVQQESPTQPNFSGMNKEDLILSKLEIVNARLEIIEERLEKIEEIASS